MIKEVKYRGVTTTPSDYESPDGDLATSSGIVLDGGRLLVPRSPDVVSQGETTLTFTNKPIFKHVVTDGTANWISYGDKTIDSVVKHCLFVNDSSDNIAGLYLSGEPKSIQAIGNTLIVTDADGSLRYVAYSGGTYKYLGDHIPTVRLQFGIRGALKRKLTDNLDIGVHLEGWQTNDLIIPAGAEDTVSNRVLGEIERTMKELGDDEDLFSAPFMVRYAVRLYDGSYTNISAPILMNNSFGKTPVVGFFAQGEAAKLKSFSVYNVFSELTAKAVSGMAIYDGWDDVVKSIDVFVSRQFRNYKVSERVGNIIPFYGDTLSDLAGSPMAEAFSSNMWMVTIGNSPGYLKQSFKDMFNSYFDDYATTPPDEQRPRYQIDLPYRSETELIGEQNGAMTLNSQFYKLYSFKLSKTLYNGSYHYWNSRLDELNNVPVEHGIIPNIETQPILEDDYYSNDKVSGNSSFVFNSSLMLGGVTRELFNGFAPNALNEPLNNDHTANVMFNVLIEESGAKIKVTSSANTHAIEDSTNKYFGILPTYFFYPNPNAKTLVIDVSIDGGSSVRKKIDLLPHPTLNGAYYVSREPLNLASSDTIDMTAYTDTNVSYPHLIYTSKEYNPFVFPKSKIEEIGVGSRIIAIAPNTQALSQGQFGQFRVYLFSDTGIWAMDVTGNGSVTKPSPVTRDIIIGNGDSLTQLDDSLLFATKYGIMELVGKNTKCISTELDVKSDLPTLKGFGWMVDPTAEHPEDIQPIDTDFKTFIVGCKMVYDYVNARIVVFNPTSDYAYIYSAKDKAWSIISRYNLFDTINAYPDAQAVAKETTTVNNTETTTYSIVDLSTITDEQVVEQGQPEPTHEGWFITRPISLDTTNDFKYVDVVRQNGVFEEYLIKDEQSELYEGKSAKNDGHTVIKQILYGSNDLINWFVIGSSDSRLINGRTSAGFKWFRLAVKSTLKPGESISSVTFSYRIKAENPHLF